MNNDELKTYRHNIINTFFNQILELEQDEANTNAKALENAMSEKALTKLVHFFDYITQCTQKNSKDSYCNNKNSSCSQSQNCSSCCGNCKQD